MAINAGIDWLGRIMAEEVGKLAIVPYFEQAGFLLLGASSLWEGQPPGRGRVRSAELARVGRSYLEQAHYLRRSALGWADFDIDPEMIPFPENNTFPPAGVKVGPLLARGFRESRRYGDDDLPKNNEATLWLTQGALAMAMESLQIAERQLNSPEPSQFLTSEGEHGRRTFIKNVEDELELLVELPCFAEPQIAVTEQAIMQLGRSAVFRVASDLCHLQWCIETYWSGRKNHDPTFSNLGIDWATTAETISQRAELAYEEFASEAGEGRIRSTLLSIRSNWPSFYHCAISSDSWHGREEAERSELVIVALLNLLLQDYAVRHPERGKLSLNLGGKQLPAKTH